MSDLSAYAGTWVIDASHSRLGFETRHAVITKVRGHFANFEGTIVVDPANVAASSATVKAVIDSIDTGNADRDGHLKSADFFNTEVNNELSFVATGIKPAGDEFVVTGELALQPIHSVTLALASKVPAN